MAALTALKLPETIGLGGELDWIAADSIGVDPQYQRPISTFHVNRIVRKFDPYILGVLLVSERDDGTRYILDGQHRLEAIRMMGHGEALVPAMIYRNLSPEREAQMFADLNRLRLYIPPQYAFRARLMAGDKEAIKLKQIVERYGFHLNFWKPLPGEEHTGMYRNEGQISAIGEIEKIRSSYADPMLLDKTLAVLRDAWGSETVGITASLLRGVAGFIHYWEEQMDRDRLITILDRYTPQRLMAEGRDRGQFMGGKTPAGVTKFLWEQYNTQLGKKRRLPERDLRSRRIEAGAR